jgi:hypothetical protein
MEGQNSKNISFGLGNLGESSHVEFLRNMPNRATDLADVQQSGDMSHVEDE